MSGRIKLLKNGVPISPSDEPALGYEYDVVSEFDARCGTFGLSGFQLPNKNCLDKFVCTTSDTSQELQLFGDCIDAMNCHMMDGMTTGVQVESPVALFAHQMIPHHQNAVNMAKTLLFQQSERLNCASLHNEDDPYCVMEAVVRDIINTQNHQIQQMRGILENLKYPDMDDCSVLVKTTSITLDSDVSSSSTAADPAPTTATASGLNTNKASATAVSSKAKESKSSASVPTCASSGMLASLLMVGLVALVTEMVCLF
jgi:Domain of unknown function (DUF305)